MPLLSDDHLIADMELDISMTALPSFGDITTRMEVMGRVALQLAQARDASAKARLTDARRHGTEFQIVSAMKFQRVVEQESQRMRQRARLAREQIKKVRTQWKSAGALFRGRRVKYYAVRRANLELMLQHSMAESIDQVFDIPISDASRKGQHSFISNDRTLATSAMPDVSPSIASVPGLLQFMLDNRLVVKPFGPAMRDFSKMFGLIGKFHRQEHERLVAVASKLERGALDIWADVPIFGRVPEDI